MNLTPEVEKILREMASDHYPVVPAWIDPLVNAGFGGLPCLVMRGRGRHEVLLRGLKKYLARQYTDELKYISTYPECVEAIKNGNPNPSIPSKYLRSAW